MLLLKLLKFSTNFFALQNFLQFFPSGKAASAGEMNLTIPPENTSVPPASDGEKGCESCHSTVSSRWVSWGPAHDHCRLCGHCYVYWRKYGGLKLPTRWGKEREVTCEGMNELYRAILTQYV